MSTRAIIATPHAGGYYTAWCWNDGGPQNLGRELRKYHTTIGSVIDLITARSFSTLVGPRQFQDIKHTITVDDRVRHLNNGRIMIVRPHQGKNVCGTEEYGWMPSIGSMLEEDVNYVYVFNGNGYDMYH